MIGEATMDKSRTQIAMDKLRDLVASAQGAPLVPGKMMVSRHDMEELLEELEAAVDMEVKNCREINDKKGKIISDARHEAEEIIKEAEQTASRIRVNKRATQVSALDLADADAADIDALDLADEMYVASIVHTDEMLTEICDVVSNAYMSVSREYENVLQNLETKARELQENKDELLSELKRLDKEDRCQQILEIGQVVSKELYNERLRQLHEKEMESMQYSMNFNAAKIEEEPNKAYTTPVVDMSKNEPAEVVITEEPKSFVKNVDMSKNEPAEVVITEEPKHFEKNVDMSKSEPAEVVITEEPEHFEKNVDMSKNEPAEVVITEEPEHFEKNVDINKGIPTIVINEEPEENVGIVPDKSRGKAVIAVEPIEEDRVERIAPKDLGGSYANEVENTHIEEEQSRRYNNSPTIKLDEIMNSVMSKDYLDYTGKIPTEEVARTENMSATRKLDSIPTVDLDSVFSENSEDRYEQEMTGETKVIPVAEVKEALKKQSSPDIVELDMNQDADMKVVEKVSDIAAMDSNMERADMKESDSYDEIVLKVMENKKKNGGKLVFEQLSF